MFFIMLVEVLDADPGIITVPVGPLRQCNALPSAIPMTEDRDHCSGVLPVGAHVGGVWDLSLLPPGVAGHFEQVAGQGGLLGSCDKLEQNMWLTQCGISGEANHKLTSNNSTMGHV